MNHLIRQEREGGYWFIRQEGRAVELNTASYALLARLHGQAGRLDADERQRLEQAVRDGGQAGLLDLLRAHELAEPAAWQVVRHVRANAPPPDAVAAPKRIYFEITRGCNLACRSCFNDSHHRLPEELSLAEILDVNRQAYDLGVFELRYTGGECTTVAGFAEIVADARRLGFYVSIGSNGIYTDEQLSWLPYCGIDWFIFSMDGNQNAHDKVRGTGTFERVLKTLRVLAKAPAVRLRLNMTVAKHNVGQIEVVARIAAEHGVGSVNLIPLRPYGRSLKTLAPLMFDGADYYAFVCELRRLRALYPAVEFITAMDIADPEATTSHDRIVQKKHTCAAGVEACVIGPQGHVYGCSYSPASFPHHASAEEAALFIAGNIREQSLAEIWRDSRRWEIFRDMEKSKNGKCQGCSHYRVRCTGSCQIMSYYEKTSAAAPGNLELKDFQDPYCPKGAFEFQQALLVNDSCAIS